MWVVWLVGGAATAILLAVLSTLRSDFRSAARGWQLLAVSGLLLALGGLGFAIRFWEPTPGPYLANELYPFGPYLNAWAVSFGFTWLSFGLLFIGLALLGAQGRASQPKLSPPQFLWQCLELDNPLVGTNPTRSPAHARTVRSQHSTPRTPRSGLRSPLSLAGRVRHALRALGL